MRVHLDKTEHADGAVRIAPLEAAQNIDPAVLVAQQQDGLAILGQLLENLHRTLG